MSIFNKFFLMAVFLSAALPAFSADEGPVDFKAAPRGTINETINVPGDGWWPHLSPDGKYVIYGNARSVVMNLETKETKNLTSPYPDVTCRVGSWLNSTTLLLPCNLDLYKATVGSWQPELMDLSEIDPEARAGVSAAIAGGGLRAKDNHWTLVYAGTNLVADYYVIGEGGIPAITGDMVYATCDGGSNEGPICIYKDYQKISEFEIKGRVLDISAIGNYAAWGGYGGGMWGREPNGEIINLGAGLADGVPKLFAVEGKIWVATFNGFDSCVMHQWGQKNSIIIDNCPAASWDIAYDSQSKNIIIAAAGDRGELVVHKISKDSPRADLCGPACPDLPDSRVPTVASAFGDSDSIPFTKSDTLPVPNKGLPTDLGQLIEAVFKWSLAVIGLVIFARFFYAGFLWFSSAGSADKTARAKDIMKNAIYGAFILFSAYLILNTINPDLVRSTFNLPGLPGGQAVPAPK